MAISIGVKITERLTLAGRGETKNQVIHDKLQIDFDINKNDKKQLHLNRAENKMFRVCVSS